MLSDPQNNSSLSATQPPAALLLLVREQVLGGQPASESLRGLVKMQAAGPHPTDAGPAEGLGISILTGAQVTLMLLAWEPHFGNN